VDFTPFEGDPKAEFELPYDFKMAGFGDAENHSATEESAA
jgi:catechol 1,2-dioxygenase